MKNIAIIQARMGSTRFPGKVLKEINEVANMTVLEFLIRRLDLCKKLDMIWIATTNEYEDKKIIKLCGDMTNWSLMSEKYRIVECCADGHNKSALTSVYRTIQKIKRVIEKDNFTVIDITADCPFIDPFMLTDMLEDYEHYNLGYYSNVITRSFPIGFDIQIYPSLYLEHINKIVKDESHRQHTGWNILNYLHELEYRYASMKMDNLSAKGKYFKPDWRLVVDYPKDLVLLRNIVYNFKRMDFTYKDIMDYLFENPNIIKINKDCHQKIAGLDK